MASTLALAVEAVEAIEGGTANRRLVAAAGLRMGKPLKVISQELIIIRTGDSVRAAQVELFYALKDAMDDFGREELAATLAGERG